jgi:quinol monooxygenase YgiN
MSTTRIRVVVDFEIYDGKFDEFEAIAKQIAAECEQEPGTLACHFLLSADRKRCRLIEGFADQAAITTHFVNGPAIHQHIHQLQQVAVPTCMEVYGDPGPQVASMAADFAVEIFTGWVGFDR